MSFTVKHLAGISPSSIDRDGMMRTIQFTCTTSRRVRQTDLLQVLCGYHAIPASEIEALYKVSDQDGAFFVVFMNQSVADNLKEQRQVSDSRYTFLMSSMGKQILSLRVHWLPYYLSNKLVGNIFSEYGRVLGITNAVSSFEETFICNGTRTVSIEVDDQKKKEIPHLLEFACGQRALVTMAGRPPLCLKCREIGHVRFNCPNGNVRPARFRSGERVGERQTPDVQSQMETQAPAASGSVTEEVTPQVPDTEDAQATPDVHPTMPDVQDTLQAAVSVSQVRNDLAISDDSDAEMDELIKGTKRGEDSDPEYITPNKFVKRSNAPDTQISLSNTFSNLIQDPDADVD